MALSKLTIRVQPRLKVDGLDLERDTRPLLRAMIATHRHLIRGEFRGGYWLPPEGGRVRWPRTEAFGNRPAPARTMIGSGAYLSAWMGGAGSVERITRRRAEFGVDSSRFPFARVHRATTTKQLTVAESKRPAEQVVSRRQRWFLGLTYGAWMRTGAVLRTPRRPHATDNPELRRRMRALVAAWARGEPLSGAGRRGAER